MLIRMKKHMDKYKEVTSKLGKHAKQFSMIADKRWNMRSEMIYIPLYWSSTWGIYPPEYVQNVLGLTYTKKWYSDILDMTDEFSILGLMVTYIFLETFLIFSKKALKMASKCCNNREKHMTFWQRKLIIFCNWNYLIPLIIHLYVWNFGCNQSNISILF